jgi:hypothetical protein
MTELARRVATAVGADVVAFEEPPGHGYTHNDRWIARLADGRSVFVQGGGRRPHGNLAA